MSPPRRRTEIKETEMLETIVTLALCAILAGPLAALSFTRS